MIEKQKCKDCNKSLEDCTCIVYDTIDFTEADIETFTDWVFNPDEPNQALIDAAERLKGKELFKESNDRARKILSEIKSLPIVETLEEHNYLQGFINQFEEEGEHQELSNDDWTVSRFLEWLKHNNFKIVKYSVDDYKRKLKEKITKAIDVIQELPIDETSKQGGISALKLVLNEE